MLRTARAEYPCSNKLDWKPETNGPVRPGFLLVPDIDLASVSEHLAPTPKASTPDRNYADQSGLLEQIKTPPPRFPAHAATPSA
jgi:hypothetical protein